MTKANTAITTTTITKDFYCNQKFWFLTVDFEKRLTYSCCAARPEKIDLEWLSNNPGKLFNTPVAQQERQDMLNNIPVKSCNLTCWQPEAAGLASRRTIQNGGVRSHSNITASPTSLNFNLGSTCNLTCSYCSKQHSSSWRQDIDKNGPYNDHDEFKLTALDQVLLKISHNEHKTTDRYQQLLKEVENFDSVKDITISGGEPFLYNDLPDLVNRLQAEQIDIFSGLGINPNRFKRQLEKITNRKNLRVIVSAENIGLLYEFNRYGNTWENFLANIEILKEQQIHFTFNSIMSNLTMFGAIEFLEYFQDYDIEYQLCGEPDFLTVNILDDSSKTDIVSKLKQSQLKIKDQLVDSILNPYTDKQYENFKLFLPEFARRRNLNLDIFPTSMLQWLSK